MRTNTPQAWADGAGRPAPRRRARFGASAASPRAPRPDLDWNLLALIVTHTRR